jgi:hydrogenase maturation protease
LRTMVLGVGNLVHMDDGLGIHAIHQLEKDERVPEGVTLLDGGTLGMGLIGHISGFPRLLVIDAVRAGEVPGTLVRYSGAGLKGLPGKASVHQLGFADLMIAMQLLGDPPEEVVLFGIEPVATEWGAELTRPVQDALPSLLDVVIEQLQLWTRVPSPENAPGSQG